MYCVNCGVKLEDTEKHCPLCQTVCYHPDILRPAAKPLYPDAQYPAPKVRPSGILSAVTAVFVLAILVMLLSDIQLDGRLAWSGFASGAVVVAYIALVLPFWFRKPNPVIFVPCSFAAVAAYLLYIDLALGGGWFLSFAFPVTGGTCLIFTALLALLKYVRRGRLFIYGGCILALGAFMLLIEFLMHLTFSNIVGGWSLYPFTVLLLLGGYLLFLGICRPARESMGRKFFF